MIFRFLLLYFYQLELIESELEYSSELVIKTLGQLVIFNRPHLKGLVLLQTLLPYFLYINRLHNRSDNVYLHRF